jgi:hypothetical protein
MRCILKSERIPLHLHNNKDTTTIKNVGIPEEKVMDFVSRSRSSVQVVPITNDAHEVDYRFPK